MLNTLLDIILTICIIPLGIFAILFIALSSNYDTEVYQLYYL